MEIGMGCRDGWLGLSDIVLVFPMSTYVDTATPVDVNITFTEVEKHTFSPKFCCPYRSPKRMPWPFFFLLCLSPGVYFPHNRVGGHLRDPPRMISIGNPPRQQLTSIQEQISGSSIYVIHKVSPLFPLSASSRNQGQLCLSPGWRVGV